MSVLIEKTFPTLGSGKGGGRPARFDVMKATTIVDNLLFEAPPNVEPFLAQLSGALRRLHKQYPDPAQFADAVEQDPYLSSYVRIWPSDIKASPSYSLGSKRVQLIYRPDVRDMLKPLRHELVHRQQHKRSGYRQLYTQGMRDKQKKANLYFKGGSASAEDSSAAYAAQVDARRAYVNEPVEVQAYAVDAAHSLAGVEPETARRRMRTGNLWPTGLFYGRNRDNTERGRKRHFKNLYQAYQQQVAKTEAAGRIIADRLLEADEPWHAGWQPSREILAWFRSFVGMMREGSTWASPGSGHVYRISHANKTFTLVAGDPHDPRHWHDKNKRSLEALGYTVLDGPDTPGQQAFAEAQDPDDPDQYLKYTKLESLLRGRGFKQDPKDPRNFELRERGNYVLVRVPEHGEIQGYELERRPRVGVFNRQPENVWVRIQHQGSTVVDQHMSEDSAYYLLHTFIFWTASGKKPPLPSARRCNDQN